jgi:hypothetical protein
MNYFFIDNFIDQKMCRKLIKASKTHKNIKNKTEIHGGRQFLSSTDIEFYNLINNSKDWRNLVNKINSEKFLDSCLQKFDLNKKKISLVNFFNQTI